MIYQRTAITPLTRCLTPGVHPTPGPPCRRPRWQCERFPHHSLEFFALLEICCYLASIFMNNFQEIANFIWSIADEILRDDFKRGK